MLEMYKISATVILTEEIAFTKFYVAWIDIFLMTFYYFFIYFQIHYSYEPFSVWHHPIYTCNRIIALYVMAIL